MKKNICVAGVLICLAIVNSIARDLSGNREIFSIPTTLTNIIANSTNSTAGPGVSLPITGEANPLVIQVGAYGGTSSSSNLTIRFSFSYDGTNYSIGATSPYTVAVPMAASTTNYNFTTFTLPGARAVKAAVIENPSGGNTSNIVVNGIFNY